MANGYCPIDLSSEVGAVRLNIGDVDCTPNALDPANGTGFDLSDDIIQFSLDKYIDKDPITRIYLSTVDCLRYLVAFYAKQVRLRERAGSHELDGQFNQRYEHYKDLLDDWTTDPSLNPFVAAGYVINTTASKAKEGMFDDLA